MSADLIRAIGKLEGKMDLVIDAQDMQGKKLDGIDGRLQTVEKKAAVNGAVAGGVLSVGVLILREVISNIASGGPPTA